MPECSHLENGGSNNLCILELLRRLNETLCVKCQEHSRGYHISDVIIIKYFPVSALSWCGWDRESLVSKVTASQPKAKGQRSVHLAWPPPAMSGKGAGVLLWSSSPPGLTGMCPSESPHGVRAHLAHPRLPGTRRIVSRTQMGLIPPGILPGIRSCSLPGRPSAS